MWMNPQNVESCGNKTTEAPLDMNSNYILFLLHSKLYIL